MSSKLSEKKSLAEQETEHSTIGRYYDQAETAIKQAEVLCLCKPVPALNEMRYAGYHAIRYVELPEGQEKEEEHDKCIRHSRRAYYDANEFMILGLSGEVNAIDESIRGYEYIVSEILGHDVYASFCEKIIEAQEFAMESRLRKKDEEKWDNRDCFSDQCAKHSINLRAFLKAFDSHKTSISSRICREQNKDEEARKDKKSNHKITIYCSLTTAILGALAARADDIISAIKALFS